MKVERPYAYCCAQGGGDPRYCDCVNKQHGTALFDAPDDGAPVPGDGGGGEDRLRDLIITWFENRTGFHERDGDGVLSAYYGGNWISFDAGKLAQHIAALTPLAHAAPPPSDGAGRSCTCHPDDRPAGPCPQRYAASECQTAAEAGVPAGMVLVPREVTDAMANAYDDAFDASRIVMRISAEKAWSAMLAAAPKQATPTDEAASQGWRPIETAPKDAWILVFMPGEDDGMGQLHAARNRKVMNGYSWVVGHQFGHDLPKPTDWRPLPIAPESPAPGSAGEGSDV